MAPEAMDPCTWGWAQVIRYLKRGGGNCGRGVAKPQRGSPQVGREPKFPVRLMRRKHCSTQVRALFCVVRVYLEFTAELQPSTLLKTKQIPPFSTLPLHPTTPTDWFNGPTRELLQSLSIAMIRNETVAIAPQPTNNMTP
jgi:hypothetical protein